MKAKVIYGLIIGLLVGLSGFMYLYDRADSQVVIDTSVQRETGDYQEPLEEPEMAIVYLTGAVMKPDIYEVPPSSRLFQLIEMAGGFREDALRDRLNLARYVFDGEMIHVPSFDDQGEESLSDTLSSSGKVSINLGDKEDLMGLTGIGQAKAEAIIAYREANGPFQRIEDIMNVDGIKEAMFNKIKDDINI